MSKDVEQNQDLQSLQQSLGTPVEIDCFLDGVPRKAYPITLADYGEFIDYIRYISIDNIASSFVSDGGTSMRSMIAMVFLNDDLDEILQNINASNYSEFIKKVFDVQGISLDEEAKSNNKKK